MNDNIKNVEIQKIDTPKKQPAPAKKFFVSAGIYLATIAPFSIGTYLFCNQVFGGLLLWSAFLVASILGATLCAGSFFQDAAEKDATEKFNNAMEALK